MREKQFIGRRDLTGWCTWWRHDVTVPICMLSPGWVKKQNWWKVVIIILIHWDWAFVCLFVCLFCHPSLHWDYMAAVQRSGKMMLFVSGSYSKLDWNLLGRKGASVVGCRFNVLLKLLIHFPQLVSYMWLGDITRISWLKPSQPSFSQPADFHRLKVAWVKQGLLMTRLWSWHKVVVWKIQWRK